MFDFVCLARVKKFVSARSLIVAAGLIVTSSDTLFAEAPSFRFAWLSDTHVGATTGEQDLRAAVNDINSQKDLSFAVISGDVTEYGSREQLQLAKEILSGLKIPCHVLPGNHDTKWSESGATDFPRLWREEHFTFE